MKDDIFAFEEKARKNGVLDTNQANYAFYDVEDSEYYIVRVEKTIKAKIEYLPLILDITEVTIGKIITFTPRITTNAQID